MFQEYRTLTLTLVPWWRHQMETFSALLAICAGNSPVSGEFPTQRPVMRSFDVFFDQHLNKRLSKQWWGWWFETPSCPLWRHCNAGGRWNNRGWVMTPLIVHDVNFVMSRYTKEARWWWLYITMEYIFHSKERYIQYVYMAGLLFRFMSICCSFAWVVFEEILWCMEHLQNKDKAVFTTRINM